MKNVLIAIDEETLVERGEHSPPLEEGWLRGQ